MYIVARSEEEKKDEHIVKKQQLAYGAVSRKAVRVNLLEIRKTSCGQS